MKQKITDGKTGINYTLHGDYYLPDLCLPDESQVTIGRYGQIRKRYLKEHRKIFYTTLLTTGKLNEHLAEVDGQVRNGVERLMKEMAEIQGVDENLKATNQMKWVGMMNNIKNRAEEIMFAECIYS